MYAVKLVIQLNDNDIDLHTVNQLHSVCAIISNDMSGWNDNAV